MAKKKKTLAVNLSNSSKRAQEYADAYQEKRKEDKTFVSPLANNKDYRTQQAKQFAENIGMNPTTDKQKTGRDRPQIATWADGLKTSRRDGSNAAPSTSRTGTGRANFANSAQFANNFANRFMEQRRNGTLQNSTNSLYDLARQTVNDEMSQRQLQKRALDVLELAGRPLSSKGIQEAINRNNYNYKRAFGTGIGEGIRKNIAETRGARRNEIANIAAENAKRQQAEQKKLAQDRIENRKDGFTQVSKTAEPIGQKSLQELTATRSLNDRKDGAVAIQKRQPNLNGYVPEENTYEQISQDPDFNLYKLKGKTSFYDPDYQAGIDRLFGASPVDYMTQEQKDTYNYIYGRYGRDAVKEYERSILPELNRMMQEDITERTYEESKNNPLNPLQGSEYTAPVGAAHTVINFYEDRNKNKIGATLVLSILGLLAVIAASLMIVQNGWVQYDAAVKERDRLKARQNQLEAENIEALEAKANAAVTEAQDIMAFDAQTFRYNEMFNEVLKELEKYSVQDLLVSSLTSGENGLTMNVTVNTKEEAAKLIQQLRYIPYFSNVQVYSFTENEDSETGLKTISFTALCTYKVPETDDSGDGSDKAQ